MPIPNLSTANGSSVVELIESLEKQRKQLDWLLQSLDTSNVKELNADVVNAGTLNAALANVRSDVTSEKYVEISENGLIVMGGVITITTSTEPGRGIIFDGLGFRAFNELGEMTIDITTDGDATFSGTITGANITSANIDITENLKVGNTIWLGQGTTGHKSLIFSDNSSIYQPADTVSLVIETIGYTFIGGDVKFAGYNGGSTTLDFQGAIIRNLNVPTVAYASNSGNADTLQGLHYNQFVRPNSGQDITLGAGGSTLNVYVSGSLVGTIPYS